MAIEPMTSAPPDSMPLPVTVIGGYLGAGKTTLINHLLRNADGLRLAVLVNDFGEINIDADLIESRDDQVLQLAGGCVCCSIGSDLMATMSTLNERFSGIDHVLLETSGVALPGVVAATIGLAPDVVCASVIVLADALNAVSGLDDKFMGDTLARQFAAANLILETKADLADAARREQLAQRLQAIAPGVARLVANDKLPASILVDASLATTAASNNKRHAAEPARKRSRAFKPRAAGSAATLFESTVWQAPAAIDIAALQRCLAAPDTAIIRAKGFVADHSGRSHLVQSVGSRTVVSEYTPPHGAGNRLLVIHARHRAPSAGFIRQMTELGFARAGDVENAG